MPNEHCKAAIENSRTLVDYLPLIGLMAGSTNQPYITSLLEKLLIPFIGASVAIFVSTKLLEQDMQGVKEIQKEMKVTQKEIQEDIKSISHAMSNIDKAVAVNTQRLNSRGKD